MWHLSRHGGRYPDLEDIGDMNTVTTTLQKAILSKYKF